MKSTIIKCFVYLKTRFIEAHQMKIYIYTHTHTHTYINSYGVIELRWSNQIVHKHNIKISYISLLEILLRNLL